MTKERTRASWPYRPVRERLEEQRLDAGLKQGEIGARLDPPLPQSTVSLYEREPHRLIDKGPEFALLFVAAYGFEETEASHIVRELFAEYVELFGSHGASNDSIQVPGGMVMVPIVGLANGGRPDDYALPVDPKLLRGDNTRAYQVQGNSMEIGEREGIRDGTWVLVDTGTTEPVNGKVFLLEIIGDGMTVKRLRSVGDGWLFLSDNPNASEAWRDDQVRIIGRVYKRANFDDVD